MAARPPVLIEFHPISTSSQLDNGGLLVSTARSTSDVFISGLDSPVWGQIGFASRPAKPTDTGAAEAVLIPFGSQDQVIATRDLRCTLPAGLAPGETVIYAGGPTNAGTGEIRLQDDGQAEITIRTRKGNSSAGNSVRISVSSAGEIVIDAGARGRIRIAEDKIEIGDAPVFSAGLAEPISEFCEALIEAIGLATAGGNPITWTPPSVPDFASGLIKLTK